MDNNFTVKRTGGAPKSYAPRDPVPVREATETELDPVRAAGAPGDATRRRDQGRDQGREQGRDPRRDHAPHDVIADPESRDVINRENDIRAQAAEREHPDQALLRQRAYRPAAADPDHPPAPEPHANIKA
jgi:hypothetical protein